MDVERIVPDKVDQEQVFMYEQHLARYRFAAGLVKMGSVGLDIACGTGYGVDILLRDGKAAKYHGVDIAPEAIDYAKKHFTDSRLEFILSDVTDVKFQSAQFDVITSFETIEHLEMEKGGGVSGEFAALAEARRDAYPLMPQQGHLSDRTGREFVPCS